MIEVRRRPLSVLGWARRRKQLEADLARALLEARTTADTEAKDTVRVTVEELAKLYAAVSNRETA